LSYCLL